MIKNCNHFNTNSKKELVQKKMHLHKKYDALLLLAVSDMVKRCEIPGDGSLDVAS
jgi:hypothetical protein